jgi:hypothetical protein
MAERRKLTFSNVDAVIADLQRLRHGYEPAGAWNLPQVAHHLVYPIDYSKPNAQPRELTAEQKQAQGFMEMVVDNGWPQQRIEANKSMLPPEKPDPGVVDHLIEALRGLKKLQGTTIDAYIFGPVSAERLTKFFLAHAAHHLSFLVPTLQRRAGLRYADEAAVMQDVRRLQNGYAQSGNWTLPQACWHLATTTLWSIRPGPFPPPTPQQLAARPKLDAVLAGADLPTGLITTEQFLPPVDCTDAEIDRLARALEAARVHAGPFAPHRIFGAMNPDEARHLRLRHCAHHLSYLVPTEQES